MEVSRNLASILTWSLVIMFIAVMYLLIFNPNLPNSLLQTLSPIVYIVELLILVFGLLYMNGFGLGESDLGIWGFRILSIVLILLGIFFFFGAAFVSGAYVGFEEWFGVILVILGLFAAFRARRRSGQFIYVR
ncbi:MAG: hypothetical protein KGH71_01235 [Candidatus Micrarchaeota archaeon]|nr:hypothetical protein [Candidatus Micrarchaeota archaeon]